MDISARAFSLTDRPRSGHVGHQCSHALGRPNLHLVSSSRRPRLETVDRLTSSLAPHIAQFFVRARGRSFVPARRTSIASRTGAVKAGRRRTWLAAGSGVARPRLDRAEHGARIKRVGRLHRRSSSVRRRVLWPAPPRRCGQVCWRARSPARCGATASWRLRSRI
jgi:hypothetical protein